jgi:hypothetical protein
MMGENAETLRERAAQCLALAATVADPIRRAQLIHMAARFRELADRPKMDFEGIQQIFNDSQLGTAKTEPRPAQQQQQQQQPDARPEVSTPRSPICTACGKIMRLIGSEPATRYVNHDQLRYACDGEIAEKAVAHRD